MLSCIAEPVDFLAPLAVETLAEGSFEPIARLLAVEYLIGERKASRVDSLEIGPEHLGQRRVSLVFTEARHAVNVEPSQREIEGSWDVAPR
jgi:hypothetical protein